MINKKYTYAVIGASNNQQKYGYKVFEDLIKSGYKVIPINLKERKILGVGVINSILDVNIKVDVVIFVVPPPVTEKIIVDVNKKKIKNVWFQPGSSNERVLKYCKKNKINYMDNSCIMIQKNK